MKDYEPQRYRLGPRADRGFLGYITNTQAAFAGASLVAAVLIVKSLAATPMAFVLGLGVGLAGCAAATCRLQGMTAIQWAPHAITFAVKRAHGQHAWQSTQVGSGVTAGRLERDALLPPELADLEVISVGRPDGRPIGMILDTKTRTLTPVLRVRLRAFGLLDDADKDHRLGSFGEILDDLARAGSPIRRLALIKRTVPQQTFDTAAWLRDNLAHPLDHPSVRSVLEAEDDGHNVAQEHELYVAIQMSVPPLRHRQKQDEALERAGRLAADELDKVASRLQAAEIAVKHVDGALTVTALSRMLKDSFDPFGRTIRDRLDLVDPARTLTATPPGPTVAHEYWDRYRTDSADHVTWWVEEWPRLPVFAGFWQPLTLRTDVPVLTVAIVMAPIPLAQAQRQANARRTSDRAAAETRRKYRQMETAEHDELRDQGDREAYELQYGFSPWRWEAYITTSVPAGHDDTLERAVREVESACVGAHLAPVRARWGQQRAFSYTLPLCRGLQ